MNATAKKLNNNTILKTATVNGTIDELNKIRAKMKLHFVNREQEVDVLFTALLAREHVLLLGVPGVAKSEMIRAFAQPFISGANSYFDMLLTRFSEPSEVFGPKDLQAYMNGKNVILTDGFLPQAEFAFLDECFKANSAVLNALLTSLEERMFKRDRAAGFESIPLQMAIGASNELPQDENRALYDRFRFRVWIDYCSAENDIRELIKIGSGTVKAGSCTSKFKVPIEDLNLVQDQVCKVSWSQNNTDMLYELVRRLEEEGIRPSDRMIVRTPKILKARALLDDRRTVSGTDFSILKHCFWNQPSQFNQLSEAIGEVCYPLQSDVQKILDVAKEDYDRTSEALDTKKPGYSKKSAMVAATEFAGNIEAKMKEVERLGEENPGNEALIEEAFDQIERLSDGIDNKYNATLRARRYSRK